MTTIHTGLDIAKLNLQLHLAGRIPLIGKLVSLWILPVCLCLGSELAPVVAVPPPEIGHLKLIPSPQHVKMNEGTFTLAASTAVILDKDAEPQDGFAARQLIDEIGADLALKLKIQHPHAVSPEAPAIRIGRMGPGQSPGQGRAGTRTDLPGPLRDEGYVLQIEPDGIQIIGRDAAGVFYGVQTLKQIIRSQERGAALPCCKIEDWPTLRYRGWQDDISRGPIPTLDYLKCEVRTLSEFKLNLVTFYTQTAFKLKSHPMAPPDGLTAEEVQELCAYARNYHVEVVGNFQSFAHAEFLSSPAHRDLGVYIGRGSRKGEACGLNPAREETYKFLSEVYDEIAPAYESPLFMLNCDEVFYLDGSLDGNGHPDLRLKRMLDEHGVGGVYAAHVNRLATLLKKHGKTPMIWADSEAMVSPGGWGTGQEQTAFGGHISQAIQALDTQVILISWEYEPLANFDRQLKPLAQSGRRFMVAPGVSSWGHLFAVTPVAVVNISNFVRDGARCGAIGMLNTTWDDEGESLFAYNWYLLVWGAECAWHPAAMEPAVDPEQIRQARLNAFDRAYPSAFYGLRHNGADARVLQLLDVRQNAVPNASSRYATSLGYFWMDPTNAVDQARNPHDVERAAQVAQESIALLRKAKAAARYNADSLDAVIFGARRMLFMAKRVQAIRMNKASADDSADDAKTGEAWAVLIQEAEALKADYQRLWEHENRESSLKEVLDRFDRMHAQLTQSSLQADKERRVKK